MSKPVGLSPAARFILRGREPALAAAEPVLGFGLPRQACRAAGAGDRQALWLGPDEWLILAPPAAGAELGRALETAMAGLPHSLVEVSQRQVGFALTGPQAETRLSAGCPLDLDLAAFPVGMCTRTVLAKVEIVLWRTAPDAFHIEAWRSFGAYVEGFMATAGA